MHPLRIASFAYLLSPPWLVWWYTQASILLGAMLSRFITMLETGTRTCIAAVEYLLHRELTCCAIFTSAIRSPAFAIVHVIFTKLIAAVRCIAKLLHRLSSLHVVNCWAPIVRPSSYIFSIWHMLFRIDSLKLIECFELVHALARVFIYVDLACLQGALSHAWTPVFCGCIAFVHARIAWWPKYKLAVVIYSALYISAFVEHGKAGIAIEWALLTQHAYMHNT